MADPTGASIATANLAPPEPIGSAPSPDVEAWSALPPPAGSDWTIRHGASPPKATSRGRRTSPSQPTPVVLAAAVVAGIAFDLVTRAQIGIGAAAFPLLVAALLVGAGAMPNRDARRLVAAVVFVAPWLAIRTNPTTVAIDLFAAWGSIGTAASIGRSRRLLSMRPRQWTDAVATWMESLITVFPFVGRAVGRIVGAGGRSARGRAIIKGLVFALPGLIVVIALLASADAAFASLFDWWNGNQLAHLIVVGFGALGFAAIALVAGTDHDAPATPATRWVLGRTEATTIVAAYVIVYAAFVASRLLATPGTATAEEISDAARAGFFQLVAVAAITLGVLVWVRGRAVTVTGVLRWLIVAVCGLTVVIVAIALHRLATYRSAFGLTELRLGTTFFSWWLGLLFVLVAASTVIHLGRRRWAVAVMASALGWLVAWNAWNVDAVIAGTNIGRVPLATASPWAIDDRDIYDAELTVRLSSDAVPTVVARFADIPTEQQPVVREWLCSSGHRRSTGLGWTLSRARAATALRDFCGATW